MFLFCDKAMEKPQKKAFQRYCELDTLSMVFGFGSHKAMSAFTMQRVLHWKDAGDQPPQEVLPK